MATSYGPAPITALQVGTYFVRQYYQVLQQKPEYVHQFYTDVSTMTRMEGHNQDTAVGMVEIHNHVMSLNYTGCLIAIKSADAQESLSGGVLVMVTGSIQRRDTEVQRNFVQSFFLAPQEKGYFVLNDIFRFCEDESCVENQIDTLTNGEHESQLKSISPVTEPEPCSPPAELKWESTATAAAEEEAIVEEYEISENQELPELEDKLEDVSNEVSTVAESATNPAMEAASAPATIEENSGEAPKHTYASILLFAKGPSSATGHSYQAPINKPVAVVSDRQPAPQSLQQTQQSHSSSEADEAHQNASDDVVGIENGGEGRSIYVKNLPVTASASDLEAEFKRFGKIKHGGVTVVNRKDSGVCYAFIDFEDAASVRSAVGASPLPFGGKQIHVEEKRTTSISSRGRRGGGRGRGYQNESMRGRGYYVTRGRGGGQDLGRDFFNRGRGSGGHGSFGSAGGNSSRMTRRPGGNQPLQNGASVDMLNDAA